MWKTYNILVPSTRQDKNYTKKGRATKGDDYYTRIKRLIDNGAPIDGIGFQARWNFGDAEPEGIYERIEHFANLGLEMAATEFEVREEGVSEEIRAQRTADMMTLFYSHPKTVGFNTWTFMTDQPFSLFRSDGSPKLNAKVWLYLTNNKWHSNITTKSSSSGLIKERIFHGEYIVKINYRGKIRAFKLNFEKGGKNVRISL